MKRIALVINPVAGIGGKVGLKGSDGEETLRRAISLGAVPEAENKCKITLKYLVKESCEIITCSGSMGENACREVGLDPLIINEAETQDTSAEDTKKAVRMLCRYNPDLLLFAGGDGTARDVMDALPDKGIPAFGIPCGCKIHSGVYARNPRAAGELLQQFCRGSIYKVKEAEVMDIDEELFRRGIVEARLYGYLQILDSKRLIQNLKSGHQSSEKESIQQIAACFARNMKPSTLYIIGTGSTTASIMQHMGLKNTLLGIDLVYNGKVIAMDCTERQILNNLEQYSRTVILVTVIGGQGYVFGRGNQQLSAAVIRKVGIGNILIVAGKEKLFDLPDYRLYADTGDEEVNHMLRGYHKILVGDEEYMMLKLEV